MTTQTFEVQGMHCASCAGLITKRLLKLEGIQQVEVNVATERARVTFQRPVVALEHLNKALAELGYTFVAHEAADTPSDPTREASSTNQREQEKARARTDFSLPLALLFFGLMLWEIAARFFLMVPGFPFPMEFFQVLSLGVATAVLFSVGRPFLAGVIRFVRFGAADMNTLIGIGTLCAYIYSALIVLVPAFQRYFRLPEETYFDVVIVVIGFVTLGKYLEARAKARTGDAIEALLHLQVKTATVIRNGEELDIPIEEVVLGEVVRVRPASSIAVDGVVLEGNSFVDESMLTGESLPVEKQPGQRVAAGSLNTTGTFLFRADKIGTDTLLAHIIRMVEEAQGSKAPIQALADRVSAIFVPTVLGLAVFVFAAWLIGGAPVYGVASALSFALTAFIGILVIACPCALGLATPTALIVGVGKGARSGILIRDAAALEKLAAVQLIVLDKTGTLTEGKPELFSLHNLSSQSDESMLALVAALEKVSEHPLAHAFTRARSEDSGVLPEVRHFLAIPGKGVQGTILGKRYTVGSLAWAMESGLAIPSSMYEQEISEGKASVVLWSDQEVLALFFVSDRVKPQARVAVQRLQALGIRVAMLSGDQERVARTIAKQVGITEVLAGVAPEGKRQAIVDWQQKGLVVAMVGDGVNDAPALAQSDIGIAMATGTDVAIESAGITLLHGDLSKLVKAVRLSRATLAGIKQNLFFAFAFNVVGIPLAGGLLYPTFGWWLSPAFAGLAMAFSSVLVVGNALRLKGKKLE